MKLDLNEIWEFMEMAPEPKTSKKGDQWIYELVAGDVSIKNLTSKHISSLKKDNAYDTELLPSVFTFREILWQPNVYTKPAQCIPQLNILKAFCEEYLEELQKAKTVGSWPYFKLLHGLAHFCNQALKKIISTDKRKNVDIASILGALRKSAFPIIKFFIFHPMNKLEHQTDALNRLNYAVKIMLTQYNNKYFDLKDPYWNVTVGNPEKIQKIREEKKKLSSDTKQIIPSTPPTVTNSNEGHAKDLEIKPI